MQSLDGFNCSSQRAESTIAAILPAPSDSPPGCVRWRVVESAQRLVKPKLRGVFHEIGFYVAAATGVALVVTADPGRARTAGAIFAACVAACFGASAVYHRPTWRPRARAWLARVDHAGVYLLIAGSYAPFGLIVMSKGWAIPVLAIVWGGALLAILLKLFWLQAPKWLSAAIGLTLGWVGAAAFSQLLRLPAAAVVLVVATGHPLQRRGGHLCATPAQPVSTCLRVSRALPRADDRRGSV